MFDRFCLWGPQNDREGVEPFLVESSKMALRLVLLALLLLVVLRVLPRILPLVHVFCCRNFPHGLDKCLILRVLRTPGTGVGEWRAKP